MRLLRTCLLLAAGGLGCLSVGCEKKERIIDIEAPGVDIEVNKTKEGIEIETGKKKDKVLDIEAPGVDVEVRKSGEQPKN
jgi:hypothetical protein